MNPFRPSFGSSPPEFAGRHELINEFVLALEEGPGSPGRATLYVGPRGSGKTVLLNQIEDVAREHGWWVISENATPGLVQRLATDHLPALLADHDPQARTTKVKSLSAPLGMGGASWETTEAHPRQLSMRSQLGAAADLMAERGNGVLITVDEIHGGHADELRELAMAVQHSFREQRQVAFAAAGLPAAVNERLLRDQLITFLRRAERYVLGPLEPYEVAEALQRPIEASGRSITPEALDAAVQLSEGYPFLVQLVGYHLWRQHPDTPTITISEVKAATPAIIRRVGTLVHEPSLSEISDVDREFLRAMAVDDGPSRISDIAERLGVDSNYATKYRSRLLAAELIIAPARGYIDFELPYMRTYLRTRSRDLDVHQIDRH